MAGEQISNERKHVNMRNRFFLLTSVGTVLAATLTGCNKKADPTSELQKAARTMEVANPAPAAPAPAGTAQPAQPPPAQQMSQAMTAYKSGDLQDAVTQLQRLRAQAVITPEQRMALQDAMAAVMTDIYARAAKGDARAQQAVKQYEIMQNAR